VTFTDRPPETDPNVVDTFGQVDQWMYGTRQIESGHNYQAYNQDSGAAGAYQFVTKTWRPYGWSKDPALAAQPYVGSDGRSYYSALEAPAHIQDERARRMALAYFQQFGDWSLVSVAWHAGPARAAAFARGEVDFELNDGIMTTVEYSKKVYQAAFGEGTVMKSFANQPTQMEKAPKNLREFMAEVGAWRRPYEAGESLLDFLPPTGLEPLDLSATGESQAELMELDLSFSQHSPVGTASDISPSRNRQTGLVQ